MTHGEGMKKKGRRSEGEGAKKSGKKLIGIVMAGIIVSAAMMAFVPLAAAAVTSFTISPANNLAGATSAYTIQLNTTGFKSLSITIPAGFRAQTPPGGALITRADLWWDHPGPELYGYVTFTANATAPSNKVDVFADIGGATATLRGMTVSYDEGATTSIKSPFGAHLERANLTLPTATATGSLSLHDLPDTITNVTVSIGEFVQNPTTAGDYVFVADGKSKSVHIAAPPPPVPAPEFNIFGLLALVAILSVVIAFARRKK